ncbi:WXG100 family type VII secretion target [Streptomyces sp. SID10815]|uniref:WXG100 family type VII secretion target n=1 Tax=Streptomyces similanensis TaxID=1274988 RepID=A0ABP9K947_9ACTN|nr:WXG100 family type VII secretion target [Streptomyces sp. SID10815]NEA49123.1 WXG100 family type VII secretion target [Streptomyces sp. SID10815]QKW29735.1 WXG100 family type VII secretion target [Streptomyces seoulensis]
MSDKQKLEDAAVVHLQKQMVEKYDNIRKRVHNLQGVIDSLEGQWQGIGRAAFDKKQYEINTSLQNIGNILSEVIEAMTSTRNIKDSKEDEVRASVNKIDVKDGAPTVSTSALSSY